MDSISTIEDGFLYLGGETCATQEVKDALGITHIVSAIPQKTAPTPPKGVELFRIPVTDHVSSQIFPAFDVSFYFIGSIPQSQLSPQNKRI